MVKTIDNSGSNLAEVITQDLRLYSGGQIAREIVDLSHAGIWLVIGEEEEKKQELVGNIESRLDNLYAEIDRREKAIYKILESYGMDKNRL